jgi:hypothetical protein
MKGIKREGERLTGVAWPRWGASGGAGDRPRRRTAAHDRLRQHKVLRVGSGDAHELGEASCETEWMEIERWWRIPPARGKRNGGGEEEEKEETATSPASIS